MSLLQVAQGGIGWDAVSLIAGVLGPLVGVPLTVITLYLRAIREHQTSKHAEMLRRIESVETSIRELSSAMTDFERDYTTKEEWLRESMHARQHLERLMEMLARVEAQLENSSGLAGQIARATQAIVVLAERLAQASERRCGQERTPAGETGLHGGPRVEPSA